MVPAIYISFYIDSTLFFLTLSSLSAYIVYILRIGVQREGVSKDVAN